MKIVAFSDSHACGRPSGWASLFDKRVVGLFNYHYRRQHQHQQKWLHEMVKYILDTLPDVAICTGDISTSGEPSEFKETCDILKPLVNNPKINFFYVPGNHDNYVKDSLCFKALQETFFYLNSEKYKFENLPFSILLGDADFCFVNECYPVNLVLSTGIMKKNTVDYVYNWIKQKSSKPKILVGHYPLREEHSFLRFRHKLWGQKKILDELQRKTLDLSLCGHVHSAKADIDDTGRGEIIIGSVTRDACGALIEYDCTNNTFIYNKIDLTEDQTK